MAAAKDPGVRVQLNLKRGDDMLNLYATTADEMAAIVDNTVKSLPDVAKRFGLTSVAAAGVAAEPVEEPPAAAPVEQASAAAAPRPSEGHDPNIPSGAVMTEGGALSPREKARARLKGGK